MLARTQGLTAAAKGSETRAPSIDSAILQVDKAAIFLYRRRRITQARN